MISIPALELAVGGSTDTWPGCCHAVASGLRRALKKGVLCYGIYSGPIHPSSIFSNREFTHHGWVRCGTAIHDPTRWVFECVTPYIYSCSSQNPHYDFGGNRLRESLAKPCPPCSGRKLETPPYELQVFCKSVMGNLYGGCRLSLEQVAWLANMSLEVLGDMAKPLYSWICNDYGLPGLIPLDNRNLVLRIPANG